MCVDTCYRIRCLGVQDLLRTYHRRTDHVNVIQEVRITLKGGVNQGYTRGGL